MDFKDLICPDGLQFKDDHFKMGGKFGRVLFLREYASYIDDDMLLSKIISVSSLTAVTVACVPCGQEHS